MEKRILIVNVNWIGDVLFSTPFIKAVREANPKGYIASLVHPRCREVLEGNRRLDEIMIYDEEGRHKSLPGKIALITALRKKKFDTAFLLHRSFTKALITVLAGIDQRIGYPEKHRGFLLTRPAEIPSAEVHKVEYFLNIARSAGIEAQDRACEFFIEDTDRAAAKSLLSSSGVRDKELIVTICPGGNWDPKRWPKESFAALSDALIGKHRVRIVITGAKRDSDLAGSIARLMNSRPIDISGKTTLKVLAAVFERSGLVIANDTGSMHLAVAMKTKTIALFGPTSPHLTGPCGRGAYKVITGKETCEVPCYDVTCTDNSCMKSITVEEVFREAERMMAA